MITTTSNVLPMPNFGILPLLGAQGLLLCSWKAIYELGVESEQERA